MYNLEVLYEVYALLGNLVDQADAKSSGALYLTSHRLLLLHAIQTRLGGEFWAESFGLLPASSRLAWIFTALGTIAHYSYAP